MNSFFRPDQIPIYMNSMRPVLNKKALFTDMTSTYVDPPEPNPYSLVTIRFRAGKNNIDRVYIVIRNEKHLMMKYDTDTQFDYYEFELQLDDEKVEYYFEVVVGRVTCYYDMRGVAKEIQDYYKFTLIPGLAIPKWAKGAVMYQIYVDRFCNGDTGNDVLSDEYQYIGEHVTQVTDWNKYPATMGVREFYGGDLQGVLDKMDYLEGLGIDVIYFNPLFVSPSNHKYDIQDYDYIDPHIGKIVDDKGELLKPGETQNRYASRYINRVANKLNLEASNQMFIKVVKEAHKRGMKVILDGVFNHCGSFNKWMDRECIYENFEGYEKGAYVSADSPYHDYFSFTDHNRWPYNPTYDGWWGHDTLPKLNYEGSRDLYNYVLEIGKKWVSPPFNVDGWRLDVAADLGHSHEFNLQFWKDFNRAVKEANPEAIVLAEHYGSPKEWIENGGWDTVMNYDAFMEPVTWFLTGMQKHSDDFRQDLLGNADAFWGAMHHHGAAFTMAALQSAMNELSNHDHSRFLTRTNHVVGRVNNLGPLAANEGVNKAVMREAVVIQMTWPGAPTVYYGDEAGVCGFTDPDNRRTYPWGNEDKELIQFHREMIRIHKENEELKTGSLKYVDGDYNIIAYSRFNLKERCIVIVNNNDHEIMKEFSTWDSGIPRECVMQRLIETSGEGYTTEPGEYYVVSGKVRVQLPKFSAIVLKHRDE
ncbi:MAG: glycoside hydrolase family 13 protein [Lachnospiraceae bacterium]|nr:glycoside hydrolase family 13 protein [Lachnospiraceae bacterium]